jgi:hypothetical protein
MLHSIEWQRLEEELKLRPWIKLLEAGAGRPKAGVENLEERLEDLRTRYLDGKIDEAPYQLLSLGIKAYYTRKLEIAVLVKEPETFWALVEALQTAINEGIPGTEFLAYARPGEAGLVVVLRLNFRTRQEFLTFCEAAREVLLAIPI